MRIYKLNDNLSFKMLSIKAALQAKKECKGDKESEAVLLKYAQQAARNNIHVDFQDGYYKACKAHCKVGVTSKDEYCKVVEFTPLDEEKYMKVSDAITHAEILSITRPQLAAQSKNILNYTI